LFMIVVVIGYELSSIQLMNEMDAWYVRLQIQTYEDSSSNSTASTAIY